MTPISLIVDAAIAFVVGAVVSAPILAAQSPMNEFTFLRDLAGAGGVCAVIVVVYLNQKDRKEERELQATERKASADLVAKEREQSAELVAKERAQSAIERQHALDQISEIAETFSKTVLDLASRKP